MKVLMRYGRNILWFLSSKTLKNYSEQLSEDDELDPTSRLDSTCLTFVQNFVLTESFQSETNLIKTTTSMLRKKLFANRFGRY